MNRKYSVNHVIPDGPAAGLVPVEAYFCTTRRCAILPLVPDRPDTEIRFLYSKSCLRFGKLNICFPQLLGSPVCYVATEQITTIAEGRPVLLRLFFAPLEADPAPSFSSRFIS